MVRSMAEGGETVAKAAEKASTVGLIRRSSGHRKRHGRLRRTGFRSRPHVSPGSRPSQPPRRPLAPAGEILGVIGVVASIALPIVFGFLL
jgi:hypothetical protein